MITAYLGIAAFNIKELTLHTVFQLPIRGKRNSDLNGRSLQRLQISLKNARYIIIDEFAVIGEKLFGWIDRGCRQATCVNQPFGGLSIILVGDVGQLPSVGDKVLYHSKPLVEVGLQGYLSYREFRVVVKLRQNERAKELSEEKFRDLQFRLRDGQSTKEDWELLLSRNPHNFTASYLEPYSVRLAFGNSAVAEHNFVKLKNVGCPVITIKAKHSDSKAAKLSPDEFGGLEPVMHICIGAKVMLTRSLCTAKGLCNGSMGIVKDIIFKERDMPPALPIAIVVYFNDYTGPSFGAGYRTSEEKLVPIVPLTG